MPIRFASSWPYGVAGSRGARRMHPLVSHERVRGQAARAAPASLARARMRRSRMRPPRRELSAQT